MMNVFVSLGSNLHPYQNMVQMLKELCTLSPRVAVSPIVVTEPVGFSSSKLFLNAVARISSSMSTGQLKERLISVEQGLGRDRQHPDSSRRDRSADIDVLFALSPDQQCVPADIIPGESYVRPMLIALMHDLGMNCDIPYPDLPPTVQILPDRSALGTRSCWLSYDHSEDNGSFLVQPVTCCK